MNGRQSKSLRRRLIEFENETGQTAAMESMGWQCFGRQGLLPVAYRCSTKSAGAAAMLKLSHDEQRWALTWVHKDHGGKELFPTPVAAATWLKMQLLIIA